MRILGAFQSGIEVFIKLPIRATCLLIIIIIVKVGSSGVREMGSLIPEILERVHSIEISVNVSNKLNRVVKSDDRTHHCVG